MSGTQLRSGKNLSGSISSEKRENKQPNGRKETTCEDEPAMSAEVMQELKSMRSEDFTHNDFEVRKKALSYYAESL